MSARRLFVPLMANSPISAFNKTEQFFVWAYKAFWDAVYVDIQTYSGLS